MSKTIIGCNGKRVSKKELKKRLKKFKKEGFDFLILCGCTKKDIRKFTKGKADLPDFKDVDEFENLTKDALGRELFDIL
jgi:hypothetical protein